MTEVLRDPAQTAAPGELSAALSAACTLYYEWDLVSDRILWIGAAEMLACPQAVAVNGSGEAFLERIDPDHLRLRTAALARHIDGGEPFDCEYRLRCEDGAYRWVHDCGAAALSGIGKPVRLSGIVRDIDDQRHSRQRLRYLAEHEPLTGLINRRRLRALLEQCIDDRLATGGQGGVFLIGLERLDVILEGYGEATIDAVMRAAAERIRACLRNTDIVGQIGADRFAMIIDPCPEDNLIAVGEKILSAMRATPAETPTGRLSITAAIGATSFPQPARRVGEAMAQLECALTNARLSGADCVRTYQERPARWLLRRRELTVAEQVQQALDEDRLVLAQQPIVDARTRRVALHEGLARIIDENGEFTVAGAFVGIAERMGLMRQIDHRVLDLGIGALADDPDLRLAINVSGLTTTDNAWVDRLGAAMAERPDLAGRLIVEITETVALHDIEQSAHFVARLAELGSPVALDDFGAGFTSFRHLRALKPAIVKIDGGFVRDLSTSSDSALFVEALTRLASGLGIETIGECVETEQDAVALVRLGVNYLQGYHFGRPALPALAA